jgi:hypothetical protein
VTAPRHERLARGIARDLGVTSAPEPTIARLATRLAEWETSIEATARSNPVDGRILLHADRVTTEPTTMTEDEALRPLLAPGEVAFAIRPFPGLSNDDPAVILFGTPEQLHDLAEGGIAPFVDDLAEEPS